MKIVLVLANSEDPDVTQHDAAFHLGLRRLPKGAQWPSGRVLDSRLRGRGFEPHRRHCVVLLEQDTLLVQPRKTRPCLTERWLMGRKELK